LSILYRTAQKTIDKTTKDLQIFCAKVRQCVQNDKKTPPAEIKRCLSVEH